MAAVVILDPQKPINGLTDSKTLTAQKRCELAELIKKNALAWAIGRSEPSEIDRINILNASLLAMSRAYFQLKMKPDWVKVDGTFYPDIPCTGETVVKGDSRVAEISAASILAKVARDNEMSALDTLYPGYEFSRHKGYATKFHLQQLESLGATEQHRVSFSPVRKQLNR